MKVLVIEDDISRAISYKRKLSNLNVHDVIIKNTWPKAKEYLLQQNPSFVITDIYLFDENISSHFHHFKDLGIPYIVCSGYPSKELSQLALQEGAQAFLNVPIDENVLEFTLQRMILSIEKVDQNDNFLQITNGKTIHRFLKDSVVLIRVNGNYTSIELRGSKSLVMKKSLTSIMGEMNYENLVRVNRMEVINILHLKSVENNKITLQNGQSLQIGKVYKSDFLKSLKMSGK